MSGCHDPDTFFLMPMQRIPPLMHLISGHLKLSDMKDLIVRISAWLLCLIGFGSSVACSPGMVADEYGSPYASFEVKGKVTDQQGKPIPGIQVTCDAMYIQPVYTESDGSYALHGDGFPREKIHVSFEDVDGEENGGLFAARSVSVETVHVKDGDGNWDFGVYEAEANAELSLDQTQSFE